MVKIIGVWVTDVLTGDFNGRLGKGLVGFGEVHGGCGIGQLNVMMSKFGCMEAISEVCGLTRLNQRNLQTGIGIGIYQ